METPMSPAPEEPRKSNTPVIIAVVTVVLLCCCCITLGLLWQYGDAIISSIQ